NLGQMYHLLGRTAAAEAMLTQVVDLQKKSLGESHPKYAMSLNNLAVLYHETGQFVRAEKLFRDSLAATARSVGESHPNYAIAFAQHVPGSLIGYLAATASAADRSAADAYAPVLRWKGQVFVRQRRQRELAREAADPRTAQLATALLDTTRQLATISGQTPAP